MQRVGPCLLEHLKKLRGFEHIDYYPVGKAPEPGALSPDGIVEIELDSIGESGLMPVRTLEATIRVTASCGLMRSSNYYSSPLAPPCVDWNFETALEHHSTTTGVGTPSSRYKSISISPSGSRYTFQGSPFCSRSFWQSNSRIPLPHTARWILSVAGL